jgi:hypothetical protein
MEVGRRVDGREGGGCCILIWMAVGCRGGGTIVAGILGTGFLWRVASYGLSSSSSENTFSSTWSSCRSHMLLEPRLRRPGRQLGRTDMPPPVGFFREHLRSSWITSYDPGSLGTSGILSEALEIILDDLLYLGFYRWDSSGSLGIPPPSIQQPSNLECNIHPPSSPSNSLPTSIQTSFQPLPTRLNLNKSVRSAT